MSLSEDLRVSVESEEFVALADKCILGLRDLSHSRVNDPAIQAGILFCSTILEGKRVHDEGKPRWGQRGALAKYSLLQAQREELSRRGVDLEAILTDIQRVHQVLSSVLTERKIPDASTITDLRTTIERVSMPFWHVASQNLVKAKAQKGIY